MEKVDFLLWGALDPVAGHALACVSVTMNEHDVRSVGG